MSEFKIACPNCQQHLLCNESYRGVQFPCPTCGATIVVPPLADPPPPAKLRIAAAAPAPVAPRQPQPHIPRRPYVPSRPRGKSWLRTFLFAWFLGWLGVDRFYNGRVGLGIMKLLTFGGWGWWTLLDIGFLVKGTYKDGRGNAIRAESPRQKWITLGSLCGLYCLVLLVSWLLIPEEGFTVKLGSGSADLSQGFSSPEAVFEAMKAKSDTLSGMLPLLAPGERCDLAYMNFLMARAMVAMQPDESKKQAVEKEFTALVEKYHLADKLEMNANSTMEQDKAMAGKAFANVDLVAFADDLSTFEKKFSNEHLSLGEETPPVSMKDLIVQGSRASATIVCSDETEQPANFVKSDGRWFLTMAKQLEAEGSDDITEGVSYGVSLTITFDSAASMKRATAKQLLQGVAYDKSMPATLKPTGSPLQAKLEFMALLSRDATKTDSDPILDTIKKSPGVKDVQHSFAL